MEGESSCCVDKAQWRRRLWRTTLLICTFLHKPAAACTTNALITKRELITHANDPALGDISVLVKERQGLTAEMLPWPLLGADFECVNLYDPFSSPLRYILGTDENNCADEPSDSPLPRSCLLRFFSPKYFPCRSLCKEQYNHENFSKSKLVSWVNN